MLMKLLITVCVMSAMSFVMAGKPDSFNIYYIPLEVEFYVPPDRNYIMQNGVSFELDNGEVGGLFKEIVSQKNTAPQVKEHKNLRVLIVNKTDDSEMFITSKKNIVYMNKKYDVRPEIIDGILSEIIEAARMRQ